MRTLPHRWSSKVVGVTFVSERYAEQLGRLEAAQIHAEASHGHESLPILLIHNPANEHDVNAVEVHSPAFGMLGHLPAAVAERVAPALDAGEAYEAWVGAVQTDSRYPDRPGLVITVQRIEEEPVHA